MRPYTQKAFSHFEKKVKSQYLSATNSPYEVAVSGYSYPLTKNQQESSPESCERRQVGILYADIVNYSLLTEQDEEGTYYRLIESMKIVEGYVAANNGRVAHFAGDAILAEFKDADNALNCAINMQLSDGLRNTSSGIDRQILFRIGVNFGDVIADQSNIFGNAVNLTARLEELAYSGGICVSDSVRNRLKNDPSFKFVAMGKQYVKNISKPVEAFWVEFGLEHMEHVDYPFVANLSKVAS